ncbi:MAG: hypothetical protein IPH13_16145 [Planctomycetes bacterium]|nr:hypothetical protein [Planctomycetota bacterium]
MTPGSLLADPVERLVGACERLDAGDVAGRAALLGALSDTAVEWAGREPQSRCELRDACVRGLEPWSANATLVRRAQRRGLTPVVLGRGARARERAARRGPCRA